MARVLVQSHLWIWWAEIAIDQERFAQQARARALKLTSRGDGFGDQFAGETRASMIAIAAASHSLDALYGVVKESVPTAPTDNRWSTILETLKAGFQIHGSAGGGRWAREFEWLFDTRDAALHASESRKETVPHPTGTHAGPEHVLYSLESADRALTLLLEVLDTCTAKPRPPLLAWADVTRPTVRLLEETRLTAV